MKVALSQFVTLDGVSQGPGSPAEDTSDGFTRGGWLVPHMDETFIERASNWLDLADGLLKASPGRDSVEHLEQHDPEEDVFPALVHHVREHYDAWLASPHCSPSSPRCRASHGSEPERCWSTEQRR